MERSGRATRVAVVGYGYWGSKHVRVLSGLPDVDVVVVDQRQERLNDARRNFPAVGVAHSLKEVVEAVDAVLVARPPASSFTTLPDGPGRAAYRTAQRETALEIIERYNPDAVVCVGVPFGHTRPQWILPYGGTVTVNGRSQRLWADYD